MSYFDRRCYKKEKMINKTFEIDENLYFKLEKLTNDVYEASISKLVNIAIEQMINNRENIKLYKRKKNALFVKRSVLIRSSFLDKLYDLRDKYGISIRLLVNIAIRNALIEEKLEDEE